jgi:hypothetical protein
MRVSSRVRCTPDCSCGGPHPVRSCSPALHFLIRPTRLLPLYILLSILSNIWTILFGTSVSLFQFNPIRLCRSCRRHRSSRPTGFFSRIHHVRAARLDKWTRAGWCFNSLCLHRQPLEVERKSADDEASRSTEVRLPTRVLLAWKSRTDQNHAFSGKAGSSGKRKRLGAIPRPRTCS